MKRLTERWGEDDVWVKDHDYVSAVHRLAEYEDTGLEPEKIVFLKNVVDDVFSDKPEFTEHIRELLRVERDGRLVVLPCNKALTNADCIRTLTNQQLAKQLYDIQKEFCRMLYKKLGFEDELNFSEDYSDILAWLNAPQEESEKALEGNNE